MALFNVQLENLCWQSATVWVEAETIAEAMAMATSNEVVRKADWTVSESEALRVIDVALDGDPDGWIDICEQDAYDLCSAQTTLDITSLDRNVQAVQALWDQKMLERRTASAGGQRNASRL